nr:protein-S-isoprenylcysteine O-methyltransferase B-like isoform X1 [Coffea arabica]
MSLMKHVFVIDTLQQQLIALMCHTSSLSLSEIFNYTACRQLLQMFCAIVFFHGSEYVLAMAIHGKSSVTVKSLLISKSYILAMVCSLIEYLMEVYFFPGLKEHWWISNLGLAMVVIGEIIRKLAILTAGQAFTHLIKHYHQENHKLVTHGVYQFVRHPGYSGFFIWAVGTQFMLCNPLSTVAFAIVVWRFFALRIPYEEFYLRQFFGSEYEDYARRVPSGIPFVK